jgi:hypothetical protein
MVKRFFFDRVDLEGGGRGVAEAVEFAVLVGADIAEARLAVADMAVARAEVAVDTIVGFGLPPESFVEGGRRLEDLESGHG